MYHRPVCVKCQMEMRPEKNSIGCLDMASFGPHKVWEADLWKCPKCGNEIVAGFGADAISEHYMEGFDEVVNRYRKGSGLVVVNHEY